MPFLNWSKSKITLSVAEFEVNSHLTGRRLTVGFSATELGTLREELAAVLEGAGELRVDLPEGWTLFWKRREGESRLLLAHPEADAWVGTVAVAAESVEALCQALAELPGLAGEPAPLDLGQLLGAAPTGNLGLLLGLTQRIN